MKWIYSPVLFFGTMSLFDPIHKSIDVDVCNSYNGNCADENVGLACCVNICHDRNFGCGNHVCGKTFSVD